MLPVSSIRAEDTILHKVHNGFFKMSRKLSFLTQNIDNLNISFFGNILTLSMVEGPPEEKLSDHSCLCQPAPKRDHLSSTRQWESA